jgi:hypothetical protein
MRGRVRFALPAAYNCPSQPEEMFLNTVPTLVKKICQIAVKVKFTLLGITSVAIKSLLCSQVVKN